MTAFAYPSISSLFYATTCTLGGVPLGRGGPAGVVVAVVVVVFVVVVVGAFVVVSFGVVGAAVVGGPSPSTVPAVQSWTN